MGKKCLWLFAAMLMTLLWSGCCTVRTNKFCDNCYKRCEVVERRGNLSEDGKTFSLYCKTRLEYRHNPFTKKVKFKEKENTFVFPLTAPAKEQDKRTLMLILSPSLKVSSLEILHYGINAQHNKDANNRQTRDNVDYNQLDLPLFRRYGRCVGTRGGNGIYKYDEPIRVRPEDLHVFAKPFVIQEIPVDPRPRLALPYLMEDNVCHYYLAPDESSLLRTSWVMSSLPGNLMRMVLLPPAVVVDVITSPIQLVIAIAILSNLSSPAP
ncbi:MAG: hypothetical protein IJJ33_19660 [Victivallales bacterium]|nr:hypothetical protein [Victivallales bacterium]